MKLLFSARSWARAGLSLLLGFFASAGARAAESTTTRPNLIFFLIDDCSTHEFGCYGNTRVPTPNVDKLAAEGIRFTHAWATPLCVPSRTELLTGRYGFETGIYDNGITEERHKQVSERFLTLPRALKNSGYVTQHLGKWHLPELPRASGWGFDDDWLYGSLAGPSFRPEWATDYTGKWWLWSRAGVLVDKSVPQSSPLATWHPLVVHNETPLKTGESDFGPDIMAEAAAAFVRNQHAAGRSFFLYYAEHLTHAPHTEMRNPDGTKTKPGMEANVRAVDAIIGRLVATLKESGAWENTLLFVAGDNPTNGLGKGAAAELGAHIPLIVAGGARWVKWSGVTSCLTDFTDVFPTFLEFARVEAATREVPHGRSLKPLLDGERAYSRPWLYSNVSIYQMIRDRDFCIDGRGRLWRCDPAGNPFASQLVPPDQEPEARQRLLAQLAKMPGVPAELVKKHPKASALKTQNDAGKPTGPQMLADRLLSRGLPALLDDPAREMVGATTGTGAP